MGRRKTETNIQEKDAKDRRQRRNMVQIICYSLSDFQLDPSLNSPPSIPLSVSMSVSQSCALFVSLLPFFLSTALYFYLWTPDSPPSIVAAGVKSAPSLLLAAVVLSWNGGQSLLMAAGLLFSAVGDCCLIWDKLFAYGMGAFAVAHVLYSISFLSSRYGTHSSASWLRFVNLILIFAGGCFYMYLYPFLKQQPKSDILIPGVGVYCCKIVLMASLAIRTRHIATALGGLSFVASDATLSVQVFNVIPQSVHGHLVVMVTYYLAQLLIAVGDVTAVENKADFSKKSKRS